MKHITISVSTTPTTTNVENNFQFIILLSTKLWYTLAPNSLDKLMQLISMEPLIYDLARSKITDLDKFLKKNTQCSTKLMELNYSYLYILK